jgi:hypothetical protein
VILGVNAILIAAGLENLEKKITPITPKEINDALVIIKTAQRNETGSPEGGQKRFSKSSSSVYLILITCHARGEILARPLLNGARQFSDAAA